MVGWWWEFGVWGAGRVRRQVRTLIQARHLISPNRRSAPSPARWATASAATWGRWCPSSCGTWATPSTCLVYIYYVCMCGWDGLVGGWLWFRPIDTRPNNPFPSTNAQQPKQRQQQGGGRGGRRAERAAGDDLRLARVRRPTLPPRGKPRPTTEIKMYCLMSHARAWMCGTADSVGLRVLHHKKRPLTHPFPYTHPSLPNKTNNTLLPLTTQNICYICIRKNRCRSTCRRSWRARWAS